MLAMAGDDLAEVDAFENADGAPRRGEDGLAAVAVAAAKLKPKAAPAAVSFGLRIPNIARGGRDDRAGDTGAPSNAGCGSGCGRGKDEVGRSTLGVRLADACSVESEPRRELFWTEAPAPGLSGEGGLDVKSAGDGADALEVGGEETAVGSGGEADKAVGVEMRGLSAVAAGTTHVGANVEDSPSSLGATTVSLICVAARS